MSVFGGKVALVTGGASGIGKALGEELARRGAEVVLADRQLEAAAEIAGKIGGRARAVALDVRDFSAFDRLARDLDRIDFLFNNAGIAVGGPIQGYTLEDWNDVFDVNLRGVAHGIQAVYPRMIAQGAGHIVNTASVAGLVPAPFEGSYAATKHAVVGLSKALRVEAQRHGVRVSVVCPGAIRTPILTGGTFGRIGDVDRDRVMKQWERVRPMDPAEFARATLDRVARNEAIIVLPSWWRVLWWLDRLSPSITLAIATWTEKRLRADLGL